MAKRKAPEKGVAKRPEGKAKPGLEESAAALDALGVDPASVLRMAVWAERLAAGRDPGAALEVDPRALFAPTVLYALARAALSCRYPNRREAYRQLLKDDRTLYLADLAVDPEKEARQLLLRAYTALSKPNDRNLARAERELRVTKALVRARKVQLEAERIAARHAARRTRDGKPDRTAVVQARQNVAEDEGTTVEALQKCIREARALAPDAGWPEIMPERRPKRRA